MNEVPLTTAIAALRRSYVEPSSEAQWFWFSNAVGAGMIAAAVAGRSADLLKAGLTRLGPSLRGHAEQLGLPPLAHEETIAQLVASVGDGQDVPWAELEGAWKPLLGP